MRNCPYCARELEDAAKVCQNCSRNLPVRLTTAHTPDESLTPDDCKEMRNYLLNLRDHFEHYHQRKENMSWAAATLYLAGASALASIVLGNDKLQLDVVTRLLLVLAGLVTFGLVLRFIRKQFSDRHIAAHVVASCGEVLTILYDREFTISYEMARATLYQEEGNKYIWPKMLCERLEDKEFRGSSKLTWNEVSPVAIMLLWTAAVAATSICWPSECSQHPQYIVVVILFAILLLIAMWLAGYRPPINTASKDSKQKSD